MQLGVASTSRSLFLKIEKCFPIKIIHLRLRFPDETLHICSFQGQESLDCILDQWVKVKVTVTNDRKMDSCQ